MATIIEKTDLPSDLQDHELVQTWLDGANASAVRIAPCLVSEDPAPTQDQLDEAKLVLVGTVTRWFEAGAGSIRTKSAGPFSETVDTRVKTGYNLWPSEMDRLRSICNGSSAKAFAIDTAPGLGQAIHRPWCALFFRALYCSCGADIAGYPVFEEGY